MNMPRPKPDLDLFFDCIDFIYGSPKISKISFGNPNPSSSIIMLKVSLSLSIAVSYTHLTLPTKRIV